MKKIFPLLFTLFLFLDPLYMALCSFWRIKNEGSILKLYLVIVSCISMFSYFFVAKKKIRHFPLFVGLILFAMLYYSTSIIYGYDNDLYMGQLLRWGAQCVPAVLMGVIFAQYNEKDKLLNYIPYCIVILTPFIAGIALANSSNYGQYTDDVSGLNYQLIAYYMAVFFGISGSLSLFSKKSSKMLKYCMFCLMTFQAVVCMTSGGRGGFVLLIVNIIFISFVLIKRKKISYRQILLIYTLCFVLIVIIGNYYNIWDSAGFQRVINPIAQQTGRKDDWLEVLTYFEESPIFGNGLGSDFYTWGFYSHNILVDFLAETGVIGTIILCHVFFKMEKTIMSRALYQDVFICISFFALYGIVMNCFSGYWITTYYNWLIFGIYYGQKIR